MPTTGKRKFLGRGKGRLNAAGPQSRFIVFLFTVLIIYTIILRLFQRLAESVPFLLFITIALSILLVFVGVVSAVYSHKFFGPLFRIRSAIEHMAEGDTSISLRLRDSDEPLLQDLVQTIGRLCEHSRCTHAVIRESALSLFDDIVALRGQIQQGEDKTEILKQLDTLTSKLELLGKTIQLYRK